MSNLSDNSKRLLQECINPQPNINEIRRLLKCDDVDVNCVDPSGNNVLTFHISHADDPDPVIITTLVKAGVDINYIKTRDGSALFLAASIRCSTAVLKTLVELGAEKTLVIDKDHRANVLSSYFLSTPNCQHIPVDNQTVKYLLSLIDISNKNVISYELPVIDYIRNENQTCRLEVQLT